MSVEFHILHTLIPVGCWWGHSTIHSSKRSRRARLNLPRGESPSLLMQVAPLPVRCERMRNGNNKPSSWSKSSCIVTSFWCLLFSKSKIMSDSVILCDRSAYHFENECSFIRKSQVWGALEQTKRTPTAVQRSFARMGSNLEGASMKGHRVLHVLLQKRQVWRPIFYHKVPTFQALCVQLHPWKNSDFKQLKRQKSSTNTSFVASNVGVFQDLVNNHFCWGSTGHGHVQALGALTQASTVIVAPPKEDLLEFFQICRLV